jgi:hypothetical protein
MLFISFATGVSPIALVSRPYLPCMHTCAVSLPCGCTKRHCSITPSRLQTQLLQTPLTCVVYGHHWKPLLGIIVKSCLSFSGYWRRRWGPLSMRREEEPNDASEPSDVNYRLLKLSVPGWRQKSLDVCGWRAVPRCRSEADENAASTDH